MAAPRGETYTPKRGPLAGQTFRAPPGRTAPTAAYNAYQNALARVKSSGTYPTYAQQRKAEGGGTMRSVVEFIMQKGDLSRSEAQSEARDAYNSQSYRGPSTPAGGSLGTQNARYRGHSPAQGRRKHDIMKWLADNGYIESDQDRDDAWDSIDY